MERKDLINSQRIVIKIGTSSLLYKDGAINLATIDQLAFVISDLWNQGKEVLLVSSGAIGVGMSQMKLKKRPVEVESQQAIAAIGQAQLMNIYSQRFRTYGREVAQVLLTRDVIDFPQSRKNVINTLEALLQMGVVPIINENDTVSVDELDHKTNFGDNDQLSVVVSIVTEAELLIMLSDIDGFFSANPNEDKDAVLYGEINEITEALLKQAGGSGSNYGTGGMHSKLLSAKRLMERQGNMVLARGKDPLIIKRILNGEQIGTLFSSKKG